MGTNTGTDRQRKYTNRQDTGQKKINTKIHRYTKPAKTEREGKRNSLKRDGQRIMERSNRNEKEKAGERETKEGRERTERNKERGPPDGETEETQMWRENGKRIHSLKNPR